LVQSVVALIERKRLELSEDQTSEWDGGGNTYPGLLAPLKD
jgi:hypothetical protein